MTGFRVCQRVCHKAEISGEVRVPLIKPWRSLLRMPRSSAVYVEGGLQSEHHPFFFVMTICRVFNAFLLQGNICHVLIIDSRPCLKDGLLLGVTSIDWDLSFSGLAQHPQCLCLQKDPCGPHQSSDSVDSGCWTAAPWEAPNHTQVEEFLLVKPCRLPRQLLPYFCGNRCLFNHGVLWSSL